MAGWWGEDSAIGSALDDMMGSWANLFDTTSLSTGNWWGSPMGQSFMGSNPQGWSSRNLTNNFLSGSGFYGGQSAWSGFNSAGYSQNWALSVGKEFPGLGDILDPSTWEESAPQGGTGSVTTGVNNVSVGAPSGQSKTRPGVSWDAVNQWDEDVLNTANLMGVPASHIKAVILMESNGDPNAAQVPQTPGLMQASLFWYTDESIKKYIEPTGKWGKLDPKNPEDQILVGAAVLRLGYDTANQQHPDWTEEQKWDWAHSWYLNPSGGGDTHNGRSNGQYVEEINAMIAEIEAAGGEYVPMNPGGIPEGAKPQPTGNRSVDQMVLGGLGYVGMPYIWGGPYGTGGPGSNTFDRSGAPQGFDCSGFTAYLLRTHMGLSEQDISTGSYEQFNAGKAVGSGNLNLQQLKPGDLVFFNTDNCAGGRAGNCASHVGMYIGNGQMVHAANENDGVIVSDLNDSYWQNSYLGARRYV